MKVCVMNCGPTTKDMRSRADVMRECADCEDWPDRHQAPANWRGQAAGWLRAKARAQECVNIDNPRHAAVYPSWSARVDWLDRLADELDAEVGAAAFGLEPHEVVVGERET